GIVRGIHGKGEGGVVELSRTQRGNCPQQRVIKSRGRMKGANSSHSPLLFSSVYSVEESLSLSPFAPLRVSRGLSSLFALCVSAPPRFKNIPTYFAAFCTFFTSNSAICTAFVAAPLRRLSLTHQKARPLGLEMSSRMRPMKTSSLLSHSLGIG